MIDLSGINSEHLDICIGHKPPDFLLPEGFLFLTPSNDIEFAQNCKIIRVSDYDSSPKGGDLSTLSEYRQLFELSSSIRAHQGELPRWIRVMHYRKFLSYQPGSKKVAAMPYAFEVDPESASRHFYSASPYHLRSVSRPCYGPEVKFGLSSARFYSRAHVIDDYCRFVISLRETGILSSTDLNEFIGIETLIPSPSLGVFELDSFVSTLDLLERAWRNFYENFYVPRAGYQRRVGGFLLERLHSFLLLTGEPSHSAARLTDRLHLMLVSSPTSPAVRTE